MAEEIVETSERDRNEEYVARLVERQFSVLEETSAAIDQKASTILGFLALILALALQVGFPKSPSLPDLILLRAACGLMLVSLVLLILCIAPKQKRFDPDPGALKRKYWNRPLRETREVVTENLADVWCHNRGVHDRKALLFEWGLGLAVGGLLLLAFDILLVRVIST